MFVNSEACDWVFDDRLARKRDWEKIARNEEIPAGIRNAFTLEEESVEPFVDISPPTFRNLMDEFKYYLKKEALTLGAAAGFVASLSLLYFTENYPSYDLNHTKTVFTGIFIGSSTILSALVAEIIVRR